MLDRANPASRAPMPGLDAGHGAAAIGGDGPAARRRLYGLQYLRGMAATGVLIFHVSGNFGYDFAAGEAGVDLFFLLSGFLMIAITSERSRPSAFLLDRVRRIVPVYWFATAVLAVGIAFGLFRRATLDPVHLLASLAFLPHRDPASGMVWPVLVPGWTLNFEMMFYVVFAALMRMRDQQRQVAALTLLFALLVSFGALVRPTVVILVIYTDPLLLEFAAGCWVGLVWKGGATARHRLLSAASWIAAGIASLLIWRAGQLRVFQFGFPALLVLSAVLILERRRGIARVAVPLFLGDASYSIYLWHATSAAAMLRLLQPLALPAWAAISAAVAAGLATGSLAYLLVERPLLRLLRERAYIRRAGAGRAMNGKTQEAL